MLSKKNINKILVVNVNWVGDVIFSSPVFKALKEQYPESEIVCMAVPRVVGVLEHVPYVDRVIVYDEQGQHKSPLGKLRIIRQLFREKFQMSFLLHGSLTRALLVFLAGIPVRVGYSTKKRKRFLTHIVSLSKGQIHRSDYYLGVVESFGVSVKDRKCCLDLDTHGITEIDKIFSDNAVGKDDFVVVLNSGGNWDLKQWPLENFAHLANILSEKLFAKIVLTGAEKDISRASYIEREMRDVKLLNLAGKTDLSQLMALMKKVSCVISADSGPLHIASSVGTSVVGIFGPTDPGITGPRGSGQAEIVRHEVGCNDKACYFLGCPDNICMKSIGVNDVVCAIKKIKY